MNAAAPGGLVLSPEQAAAIRAAAAAAYPREFCALLIGIDRPARKSAGRLAEVTRVVFADNVDPAPEKGFELDPRVLAREMRALREAARAADRPAERLLGHVHSHPDAPARPSARDLAQAFEPDQIWLIVPVRGGRPGAPRAFRAESDPRGQPGFRPVRLTGSRPSRPTTNSLIRRPARSR